MIFEISRVAFEIKALNCCKIWFHGVISIPKNMHLLNLGSWVLAHV